MKTILTSLIIFTYFTAICQAPQGLNYQAVARNSAGVAVSNQPVGVKFNIHHGTSAGTVFYSETQTATTNQFGLLSLVIGQGTVVSGGFAGIDWSSGPYYCEVLIDLTGGTNYQSMGSAQLMSVPYALFANNGSQLIQGFHNTPQIGFSSGLVFHTIDSVTFTITGTHTVYFQADVANWGQGSECTGEIKLNFDGNDEDRTMVMAQNRAISGGGNNSNVLATSWMQSFAEGTHVVKLLGSYTTGCGIFTHPHLNVITFGN